MPRLATTLAAAITGANLAAAGCTFRWWADKGDTCASMSADWEITKDDFIKWNPSVGEDCKNGLVARKPYCVEFKEGVEEPTTTSMPDPTYTGGIPAPTQPGLAKNCDDYYYAKSGDTCGKIVDQYPGVDFEDFYKWNPAVGKDCFTLYADYWYCVSVNSGMPPTAVPTTTEAPTTTGVPTTTGIPTMTTTTSTMPEKPSPTQAGLTEDCREFYKVQDGDYCYKIIEKYNNRFTLDEFVKWNPAAGDDCTGLWAGYYVCVKA